MKVIFYQPGLTSENINRLPWSTIYHLCLTLGEQGIEVLVCTTKSTGSRKTINTIDGIISSIPII